MGWISNFLERIMPTKEQVGGDATAIVIDIPAELYYKELAIYTATSLIANAISRSEIKCFVGGKPTKSESMKRKAVYQIVENAETRTADINIYGDITSAAELYRNWGCSEGEVSARDVKQAIEGLDVDTINVYINSYGGEVAEALAIYSSLKRHSAQIHTFCDGFACSAATIVFCAGDVRTMGAIALLMIHNCMSYLGYANSEEMRKAAEDNDKINQSSIEAYKSVCNLTEDEIKEKMNAETWLTAQECLDFGFATEIADQEEEDEETQQTAFSMIRQAVLGAQNQKGDAIMQKLDDIQATLDGMKKAGDPQHLDGQKQTGDPKPEENFLKTLFTNLI